MFGGGDGVAGYAPLALVAQNVSGLPELYWVHGNHIGVPQVTTNAAGQVVDPGDDFLRPGFPGQSQVLTDLYYNRARDYDPVLGRYIQADPIGLLGGANPYLYADGDPVNMVDPLGLSANDWFSAGQFAGIAMASDALAAANARNAGRANCFGDFDAEDMIVNAFLGYGAGKVVGLGWRLGSRSPFLRRLLRDEAGAVPNVPFSKEKQALVEMAKSDKRRGGVSRSDMDAYRELNAGLPDPFPSDKVRYDPGHLRGAPHSRAPHGHVGPVDHIPVVRP